MDADIHAWVVVTALAVIFQVLILGAMALALWMLKARIERLLDRDVEPLLGSLRELVGDGRKAVEKLNTAADQVAEFTRNQAGRLDQLMAEASDRARLQVIRADELVSDTFARIERASAYLERSVTKPVREMEALLAGVRTAFDFLFRRRRAPMGPVERTTHDEELFI